MSILRYGIAAALASLVAAAVVAVVVDPWGGGEAAGETITYRSCNVTVQGPPPPRVEDIYAGDVDLQGLVQVYIHPTGELPTLTVSVPGSVPMLIPDLEGDIDADVVEVIGKPSVTVNAETGQVIREHRGSPEEDAALQEVLDTLQVEELRPDEAGWPYTDKWQVAPERIGEGERSYLNPDPSAGLLLGSLHGMPADERAPEDTSFIWVGNCRSQMWVGTKTGKLLERSDIHPDDVEAFGRFAEAIGR